MGHLSDDVLVEAQEDEAHHCDGEQVQDLDEEQVGWVCLNDEVLVQALVQALVQVCLNDAEQGEQDEEQGQEVLVEEQEGYYDEGLAREDCHDAVQDCDAYLQTSQQEQDFSNYL